MNVNPQDSKETLSVKLIDVSLAQKFSRFIQTLLVKLQGIIYPGSHSNLRVNSPLLRTKVSLALPKLRCTRLAYHTLAVPASRHRTQR